MGMRHYHFDNIASGFSDHEREERRVFDEVIHSPIRLQVCAVLAAAASPVRFSEVQTALGITDSHLSKNVRVLLDAGYVDHSKHTAQDGARSRSVTMLALTGEVRTAYRRHAAWMEHLTWSERTDCREFGREAYCTCITAGLAYLLRVPAGTGTAAYFAGSAGILTRRSL